jgi:hypothetical protein
MGTGSEYFDATLYQIDDGTSADGEDVNNPVNALEVAFDKLPSPGASTPATKGFGEVFEIVAPTANDHPASYEGVVKNKYSYKVSSGSAGNYIVSYTPSPAPLVAGLEVLFKANHINPGASTLNVNGTGAVAIKRVSGSALTAGDIPQNGISRVVYDGTYWQLTTGVVSSVGGLVIDDAIFFTGVGTDVGTNLTGTATQNTFTGYEAGKVADNASGNCLYGHQSGKTMTSAQSCSCYGVFSGAAITTGLANSLYGASAGIKIEDGTHNAVFGGAAGSEIIGGNRNTCLGGLSGQGIITASNCVFLGYSAGKSHLDAGGAALYIANGDDGGAYANTWLYGDSSYNVHLKNGHLILTNTHTPASASATGTAGQVAWDADYIYICIATDTWKRVAISTWP